ncbi:hypothetical protein [Psychrilyobacter sp.]|uniref:hypothetical protein n=1 Tax=Psychrilyobacter sp. TaxID=2586924 RepID=UPI003017D6D4
MLNRILILFGNELNKNNLLVTGQYLKEKYETEVYGLYVRDIRKYEVLPPTVEGLAVDTSANLMIRDWEKTENIQVEELKKVFKNYFPVEHLLVEDGVPQEILQEKMFGFDLIIAEKSNKITDNQKDLLRHHYKPVLLIPENNSLKVEKVIIANSKSERVNKSVFAFLNMFDRSNNFTSVAVNLEDETDDEFSKYMEIAGKTLNILELEGKAIDIISEKSKEFDILIMGDLKHSFLLEKLTRDTGLKLLENIEIPIYIG